MPPSMVTEVALFDLSGWLLATGTVTELRAGGVVGVSLPPDKLSGLLPVGREVRFQLTLPAGEVRGMAEVAQVETATSKVGLRLQQIENDEGLPRLLDFLQAWRAR